MKPTYREADPLQAERARVRRLIWRKSTRSGGANNDCVEAARDGEDLLFRDSKQGPDGPYLRVPQDTIAAIKATVLRDG